MEATGPEALTCKVFILVMTVVEKTLGTGKTRHALDTLLQHIGGIPARSGRIVRLNGVFEFQRFLFQWNYSPERRVDGNVHIALAIIWLPVLSDPSCVSSSFLYLSLFVSCSDRVKVT